MPGALGGPWRWAVIGDGYAQASPPAALQQLSWGLALLIVVVSCVYRVRAWRAWAIIVGWIAVADVFPVVIGRLGVSQPALLGLQARYVTDAVSVLALCLGLAFLPLAGEEDGYRFRLPGRAAPGAGGRRLTRLTRATRIRMTMATSHRATRNHRATRRSRATRRPRARWRRARWRPCPRSRSCVR